MSIKNAYTLIELLIVFSIVILFSVLTIPSYINFNRNQEVKQSALSIKSQLRDAQNRSTSGEKDQTDCVLSGYSIDFTINQNSFSILGSCSDSATNYTLPSKNVIVSGFYNASSYPSSACSPAVLANNSLRIVYKNLNKGSAFYDWNTALQTGSILDYAKIGIKVSDTTGNSFVIIVSKDGEIYDVKSC